MKRRSRKRLLRAAASLLALSGLVLCLVGPALPAGAQQDRVLQVWPDRSVGVTSGLLEGATAHTVQQVFPLGTFRTSTGAVVQGRTYLHFPLDVFPPGTEIVRATLHMYADTGSRAGEATFGLYRVLDPWVQEEWGGDPAAWPALLTSPIAVTEARFDSMTPAASLPVPAPVDVLPPTPTPTVTPADTPTPTTAPASTATPTPTATSTPTATATATLTLTATPTPILTVSPTLTVTLTPSDTESHLPGGPGLAAPAAAPRRRVLLRYLWPWNKDDLTSTPPTSPLATPTKTSPATSPTASPPPTSVPTPPTPLPPSSTPVVTLGEVAETWLTWDVTALTRAWLAGEAPDQGIALASAPDPNADPDEAGDLLIARWLAIEDPETLPYLIVEIKVYPVTPTPTATPAPMLPPAGGTARWRAAGLLFVGAALLALGLAARR